MYFDDFYTGPIIVDTIPPELLSLTVASDSSIILEFSEPLEPTQLKIPIITQLLRVDLHPLEASLLQYCKFCQAHYFRSFQSGCKLYSIHQYLIDLAGNNTGPIFRQFSLHSLQPYDVVINEIMADPDPSVGLPLWEYIELIQYNNNGNLLKQLEITIGSTPKIMNDVSIGPEAYLILCRPEAQSELSAYGATAPIASLSLNNTGQVLQLFDDRNILISRVTYTDKWNRDDTKSNGGWSLEQIDPSSPCLGSKNWMASINISGGTPGGINSVYSTNQLIPLPEMVVPISNHQIK
jgi:hypothetical protein